MQIAASVASHVRVSPSVPAARSSDEPQVRGAQSAPGPSSGSRTHAFGHLTKDDHDMLFAATGVRLAADGTVSENTTGKMPDWGLFLQIDGDRADGRLNGPVTETYLQDLATAHERFDPAFDRSRIDAAVDFLRRRDEARWAEVAAARSAAGL